MKKDGLCFGLNYFAYDRGTNIGDVRIWRGAKRKDFTERDAKIVDAIGPSFVNALLRAENLDDSPSSLSFSQLKDDFQLGNCIYNATTKTQNNHLINKSLSKWLLFI